MLIALQAAFQRASGLGYWTVLMFGAIRVGFSGALSTVSTFVAEASSQRISSQYISATFAGKVSTYSGRRPT